MAKTDFEVIICPVCKSKSYKRISSKGQFNMPTNTSICKTCGLMYLNPRWTKDKYLEFYKSDYDKLFRPKKVLKKQLSYNNIKAILSRVEYNNIELSGIEKILEVGAGNGESLDYLKKEVFVDSDFYAIEPSKESSEMLRNNGVNVLSNDVDTDWYLDYKNQFDFIIMRHVLEHILNPVEVMKKISHVLKPNGILYLAVPNAYKPRKPLLTNYLTAVHVLYLNKDSLENILQLANLDATHIIEGDDYNQYEICMFCKKSTLQKRAFTPDIESYFKQLEIIQPIVRSEKKVIRKKNIAKLFGITVSE